MEVPAQRTTAAHVNRIGTTNRRCRHRCSNSQFDACSTSHQVDTCRISRSRSTDAADANTFSSTGAIKFFVFVGDAGALAPHNVVNRIGPTNGNTGKCRLDSTGAIVYNFFLGAAPHAAAVVSSIGPANANGNTGRCRHRCSTF